MQNWEKVFSTSGDMISKIVECMPLASIFTTHDYICFNLGSCLFLIAVVVQSINRLALNSLAGVWTTTWSLTRPSSIKDTSWLQH